jgi:hypothetical protein
MSNHCEDCNRSFITSKGYGSHLYAYHGIKGKSARAIRHSRRKDAPQRRRILVVRPGEVYGFLTVQDECNVANPNGSGHRTHARVRCVCEKAKLVSKSQLISGGTISCGCHREGKKVGADWRALHRILCHGAIKRNLPVEISSDHVQMLGEMSCFYCGREPSNTRSTQRSPRQTSYNGIDRADNQRGYLYGNVLPCCRYCNRAKRDYPLEIFIEQIRRYGSNLTVERVLAECVSLGKILEAA